MLQELFRDQRRYLDFFFERLDLSQAEKALEKMAACKGSIVFSGVGKSGHIAQKISATLLSTGTRSIFLSPADALHGDLGFVGPEDLFIALSKSGASEELLAILPVIRKKGAGSIAIVSQANSKLAKESDLSVLLPVERELCPYDLAPTTSTEVQLIFGDLLAIALMQKKQFKVSDFALNHPAGQAGRKATLLVSDLMLRDKEIPLCKPTDTLLDALHELSSKKCGCILVADEQMRLLGIFTDGDLRRAVQQSGPKALETTLSRLMTPRPKSASPEILAWEAMRQMQADQPVVTVLPVLEQGKIVGLLRIHDILGKHV